MRLASGEAIGATTVLSNADPKRTLLGLVGGDQLDPATAAAIGAYRCEGASMKINLAVGELPRIDGTPAGLQDHHRGLIQLTLPLAEMDADQAGARARGSGAGPARRALRAERARPLAGAARAST